MLLTKPYLQKRNRKKNNFDERHKPSSIQLVGEGTISYRPTASDFGLWRTALVTVFSTIAAAALYRPLANIFVILLSPMSGSTLPRMLYFSDAPQPLPRLWTSMSSHFFRHPEHDQFGQLVGTETIFVGAYSDSHCCSLLCCSMKSRSACSTQRLNVMSWSCAKRAYWANSSSDSISSTDSSRLSSIPK